jgi:tetratricopeptide (TPR) repeat protein
LRLAVEINDRRAGQLSVHPQRLREWSASYLDLAYVLNASGKEAQVPPVLRQAVAAFSWVIDLGVDAWWARNGRAEAFAQLGQWAKANADLAKAVESAPERANLHYRHALTQLALADAEGYRKTCADLLARFGKSADLDTASRVTWTCVLAPDAVTDWSLIVRLAEKCVAADPMTVVAKFGGR